jgi:NACHT domain
LDGTGFIDILLRIAEKNGGKILGVAADSASKLKKYLEVNFSDYFENTIARCSSASTLFDRSKSMPLSSLYVRTHLEYSRAKLSDQKLRDQILDLPEKDSIRIFLLIGSAGMGKTFLLRWLFLNLLENEKSKIPFYVELRGINHGGDVNLSKFLYDAVTGQRAHLSFDAFNSGMKEGSFVLILDGLDEVQRDKRDILSRQIVSLQDTCPGLIIVISSRHDESFNSWQRARRYYVLPMGKKETISLINKLPYKSDVKKKFNAEVASNLYDRHQSFLSNPLLITIMLLTYGDLGNVPAKMHIFYEQAFETLFYRHDTWKEAGYQRKHYSILPVDEFRDCLSSFCISSYKKSQYEFTMLSAIDFINKAAKFERVELNAAEFLKDLEESICMLRRDGLMYTFTHRSFQEYFSAVFISRAPPIALRSLLDELASRRGDVVIPMATDMNRSLIEREWVLPRLRELASSIQSSPDAFSFAREVAGNIVYDGKAGKLPKIRLEGSDGKMDFLSSLGQLYPQFIPSVFADLTFSEQDVAALKEKWDGVRDEWWKKNQGAASLDAGNRGARRNDFVPHVNYVLSKAHLKISGTYDTDSTAADKLERFITESNREFELWRKDVWILTDEDTSWLDSTSCFKMMNSLADQVLSLQRHLEMSLKRFREVGAELLD